ncbi:MAG: hypothetical protein IPN76_12010 [Saprospiraceae bacterium]|nr:hypothetical protein [Saprospiraceae bacterium]
MDKITSPGYVLPQVLAIAKHQTLKGGVNQPLVVKAMGAVNYRSDEYVLKYRGGEGMNEMTSGLEMMGSFMAAQVEIATPEVAIVVVTDDFLAQLTGEPEYHNVFKGKGINFGSKYEKIKTDVYKGQTLTPEQTQQAARIFAFDLLIDNADRNDIKPNLFLAHDNLYVYDHEKAFGFLRLLALFQSKSPPWQLDDLAVNTAMKHFLFRWLKGNHRIDWDEAVSTFQCLDESFWPKALELLPAAWDNPTDNTYNRIRERTEGIVNHLTEFKTEIWTRLIQ